jgi:hypothetical protein
MYGSKEDYTRTKSETGLQSGSRFRVRKEALT